MASDVENTIWVKYKELGGKKIVDMNRSIIESLNKEAKAHPQMQKMDALRTRLTHSTDMLNEQAKEALSKSKALDVQRNSETRSETKQDKEQEKLNKRYNDTKMRIESLKNPLMRTLFTSKSLNALTGKMTQTFKSFNMQALGMMFGFQQIGNSIFSLLRPAMEATGIFKIMSAGLTAFFAPAMAVVSGLIAKVVGWFLGASPATKKFLGFLLLGAGIAISLAAVIAGGILLVGSILSSSVGVALLEIIAIIGIAVTSFFWLYSNWDSAVSEFMASWNEAKTHFANGEWVYGLFDVLKGAFYSLGRLLFGEFWEGWTSVMATVGHEASGGIIPESWLDIKNWTPGN